MTTSEREKAQAETFGTVFLLAQHLTRLADAALDDWGLTTRQWLLLAVLTSAFPDRAPSLSEAAERYGSSRQNVKQIALGLQERGWVRLEADPADARTTRIACTEQVRRFDSPDGVARSRALLGSAFDGLTQHDVLALRDLTSAWLVALAAEHPGATHDR